MTRHDRNSRAVELWLQNRSWRTIALQLAVEGHGHVSHQYVSRVVKRELTRAWNTMRSPQLAPALGAVLAAGWHEPAIQQMESVAAGSSVGEAQEVENAGEDTATTEIIVESFFNARHFVVMDNDTGAPHNHSYRARMTAIGQVDAESGVVIGFAQAQAILDEAVTQFAEELLNRLEVFSGTQPTTENVALVIVKSVFEQLEEYGLKAGSVTLWESPTKGVTVTLNPGRRSDPMKVTDAGDQPFTGA